MTNNFKNIPEELWRQAMLPIDVSMKQVIQNLNETALQIVMVVSKDGYLEGTLTDGDIRRGLLSGLKISSPIESIVNREPFVVPLNMDHYSALHLMQINKIHQLPVVDEHRCLVGLHLWNDLMVSDERQNLMIIMAGGQGSRLKPFTDACPKPLLPVNGKPILEHIIERAKKEGFCHFVIAIHYLGHMIEEYFGDGSRWKVKIEYLHEDSPLGTAGAISLLKNKPDAPFVVTNGDVLTDIHYGEILEYHYIHDSVATMAVRLHEWQNPYGVVSTEGIYITGFEEKPTVRNYINSGIYVLNPDAINQLDISHHCDMQTLFTRLQEKSERTIVFPMHEPWLDIGRKDDLERAQSDKH